MSVDLSQFYQTFFEESFEGLDAMESALLHLDVGAADAETINTIFRAAHSIKGGSATFGFTAIAEFTHVMETLLDQMREGPRMVTQEAVDALLQSVDCLREMLVAKRDDGEADQGRITEVKQRLEVLLHGEAEPAPVEAVETPTGESETDEPATGGVRGWRIAFKPFPDLLQSGNDPVRMFRELRNLGELSVQMNDAELPAFADLQPELAYLGWELTLLTDAPRAEIEAIFEWVDGDCELTIAAMDDEALQHAPLAAVEPAGAITEQTTGVVAEQTAEQTTEVAAEQTAAAEADVRNIASAPSSAEETQLPPAQDNLVAAAPKVEDADTASKSTAERRSTNTNSGEGGSIRVSIDKVDGLVNMVGELVITQSMLGQLGDDFDECDSFTTTRVEKLRDGLAQLERNTRELQESVMRIRMLPISFAFHRFPRMVRDLSQKLGKKIELKLSGEQTELDKTVMEKIGDPLVHLVRNAIDHGIEMPEKRAAAGKAETGVVHLNAYHQGGSIVIEVRDDGAGLNKERILAKARERGLVGEECLPDERVYDLIFDPGFSTAETVSDVSGRGVGMDVVKRNIKELGGSIEIVSRPGAGSTFTIRLPLTLAILDGQLIKVGDQTYIVPLVSIIESLQIRPDSVNAIAGQAELYKLREDYIPVVRLYDVFGVAPDNVDLAGGLLVVAEGDGQRAGLFVDDLLGQQQVVIKSLETNFQRVPGISGATILGDGTVALILDVGGIIDLSRRPARQDRRFVSQQRDAAA